MDFRVKDVFVEDLAIVSDAQFFSKKDNLLSEEKTLYPGRWSEDSLQKADEELRHKLYMVKWAFNAIPDLLIISGGKAVLVEAKLESGLDTYKSGDFGHSQLQIQNFISELLPQILKLSSIDCVIVNRSGRTRTVSKQTHKLSWSELLEW